MPIYDLRCTACGAESEVIVRPGEALPACPACGSPATEKLMSAPSSLTGRASSGLPGPGDTGCCGSTPGHAGCAGPGSCCGKGGF
jgi:putative FmdB family regulatory protein